MPGGAPGAKRLVIVLEDGSGSSGEVCRRDCGCGDGCNIAAAVLGAPLLVKLLAPGFGEEQAALTAGLVWIILPSIVFMGLAGWAQGVPNTIHHFIVPTAVGIPYNIIMICGIFLSGALWGIEGVAWVTVAAVAGQFLTQLPVLRRFGVEYRREFDWRHPALVKMGRLLLPVLIGVGATQLNIVVDRILASGLAEWSISALNYAQRILAIPQGLLAAPLITGCASKRFLYLTIAVSVEKTSQIEIQTGENLSCLTINCLRANCPWARTLSRRRSASCSRRSLRRCLS